ncbi:MAG TPA: hypothetical protein VE219_02020 [Candidatus Sulfotelmatobacter sp.]|nr:hypothetical protein [Candidatus Sulfotelmatobacter sp.]
MNSLLPNSRLTIVVAGSFAGVLGQGGATSALLQWVIGFHRLGHDVYVLEPIDAGAVVPDGAALSASDNATYMSHVMRRADLAGRWALMVDDLSDTAGLSSRDILSVLERADVLVNLSGVLRDERLGERVPARVFVDLDPAFTQLWHERGMGATLSSHTHFVSTGLALNDRACTLPRCGASWTLLPPPVVLEEWRPSPTRSFDSLTTVANWRSYGSISHAGVDYGQKAHSFRRFLELPLLTDKEVRVALAIHPDEKQDLSRLHQNRWQLVDPVTSCGTPERYVRFIESSAAELGIAKSGYVLSRCGWFSERSASYLAAGKPVLAEQTGYSRHLPVGEGLLSFSTTEDILACIDKLDESYSRHARAARELAEDVFDSAKVLGSLLDAVSSVRT